MITAAAALARARSQLGYDEVPGNRTKFGRWYGMNGVAWCAIFVSWVFGMVKALLIIGGKHSYTPEFAEWFQRQGRWGHEPKVGAVVFFHFPESGPAGGRINHVGLVEAVRPDGSIITIEGNTNYSGSRTGGGVRRCVRRAFIAGYGYPRYLTTAKAQPASRAEIKIGSKGADVRYLQKKLGLAVDGEFGPHTDAAVRRLQRSKKLTVDGEVGPKTWKAVDALK